MTAGDWEMIDEITKDKQKLYIVLKNWQNYQIIYEQRFRWHNCNMNVAKNKHERVHNGACTFYSCNTSKYVHFVCTKAKWTMLISY